MTYLHEESEIQATARPPDGVSAAVGSPAYMQSHRLPGLRSGSHLGHSPPLPVSRYYWMVKPPVVVDFVRELKFGAHEVMVKRAYCRRHGISYVLLANSLDGEDVARQLATLQPEAVSESEVQGATPLVGPRRIQEEEME